jgi:hypothetical protein
MISRVLITFNDPSPLELFWPTFASPRERSTP